MSEPFLAEIRIISWNYAPQGWAFCAGQILPINQNQALFSLLGTTYGGNGSTTFALPDLRGRAPVHMGNGVTQGQSGGEAAHTLIQSEMPMHNHLAYGTGDPAIGLEPQGKVWAKSTTNPYSDKSTGDTYMGPAAISTVGQSQPHENMQPYLTLNFIIALQGIFPSRN